MARNWFRKEEAESMGLNLRISAEIIKEEGLKLMDEP